MVGVHIELGAGHKTRTPQTLIAPFQIHTHTHTRTHAHTNTHLTTHIQNMSGLICSLAKCLLARTKQLPPCHRRRKGYHKAFSFFFCFLLISSAPLRFFLGLLRFSHAPYVHSYILGFTTIKDVIRIFGMLCDGLDEEGAHISRFQASFHWVVAQLRQKPTRLVHL